MYVVTQGRGVRLGVALRILRPLVITLALAVAVQLWLCNKTGISSTICRACDIQNRNDGSMCIILSLGMEA